MQDAAVPPPPRPPVPEAREIRPPFQKTFRDTEDPYVKDFSLHVANVKDEAESAVEVANQLAPKDASVDSEESILTAPSTSRSQEELPLSEPMVLVNPAMLPKSAPPVVESSTTPPPAVPSPPSLKITN